MKIKILTCPEIVNRKVNSNRSCHVALYALCDHSRCAPAVIPNPDPKTRTPTEKTNKNTNIGFRYHILIYICILTPQDRPPTGIWHKAYSVQSSSVEEYLCHQIGPSY